jgi:hypothetical protein
MNSNTRLLENLLRCVTTAHREFARHSVRATNRRCSIHSAASMRTAWVTRLRLPLLLLLTLPATIHAQFTVTTNGGAITITRYTGGDAAVTIPSTITGRPVTCIGDFAFSRLPWYPIGSGLLSVTIPNSVTSIGDSAFSECFMLTNAWIGSGVTNIGDRAFYNCGSLRGVYFQGNAPSSIGTNVFQGDPFVTVYCLPGTLGWGTNVLIAFNAPIIYIDTAPPTITIQPRTNLVNAYGSASFSSTVITGAPPLFYQWSLNNSNILNATNSLLIITNIEPSDLGTYTVVVTNRYGSTNASANLTMYPFLATPFIGSVAYWGLPHTLSIEAWGSGPLTYQWFENGSAIPNATNQDLTLTSIQFTNAGLYSVVVSSPWGSVTNTPAQVVVRPAEVSLEMYPGIYPGVTVSGAVGDTYVIQSNADLTNTNGWTTAATITLTNAAQLWLDKNVNAASATNKQRFYRVLFGPSGPAGASLGMYPGRHPRVMVSGVVGYTYLIQRSWDLAETNSWMTVASITLTNPVQLWMDYNVNAASPTHAQHFYRVLPGP